VGDRRAEEELEGDAPAEAERHGDADTDGEGALVRDTEVEPEAVFVAVSEPEAEAEPRGSPPTPALAVGDTPEVRVEVTLAEGVFVEEAEAVEEGVVLLDCEMLEQPLGEGDGRVERVDVVEGESARLLVPEMEGVEVGDSEKVGRVLRVEEAEGDTLPDGEGVFDVDGEEVTVRVAELDFDTLAEAEAVVEAVSVTLGEAEAEGLLLDVDVFEDVCDTEGEVVAEPPPAFGGAPAEGYAEVVVVLLLEPEREGLGVYEGERVEEGEGVLLRVEEAERDTELLADTETVPVTLAEARGDADTVRAPVRDTPGLALRAGLRVGGAPVRVTAAVRVPASRE